MAASATPSSSRPSSASLSPRVVGDERAAVEGHRALLWPMRFAATTGMAFEHRVADHHALPGIARVHARASSRLAADRGRIEQELGAVAAPSRGPHSGNHWSQQMPTPSVPKRVGHDAKAGVARAEVVLLLVARARRGCGSCGRGRAPRRRRRPSRRCCSALGPRRSKNDDGERPRRARRASAAKRSTVGLSLERLAPRRRTPRSPSRRSTGPRRARAGGRPSRRARPPRARAPRRARRSRSRGVRGARTESRATVMVCSRRALTAPSSATAPGCSAA